MVIILVISTFAICLLVEGLARLGDKPGRIDQG